MMKQTNKVKTFRNSPHESVFAEKTSQTFLVCCFAGTSTPQKTSFKTLQFHGRIRQLQVYKSFQKETFAKLISDIMQLII